MVDEVTAELRFNISFLADRLIAVTDWIDSQPAVCKLAVGYFGASTGAAAALVAAAERQGCVAAVVSRGGASRPGDEISQESPGADAINRRRG
jgi:putative phosphoribosyl transferase